MVRLDGHDLPSVVRAVLTVLPLDSFVETPISAMGVVGDPSTVPDVQREVLEIATAVEGRPLTLGRVERHDFYERSRRAFAVVATGESRAYGCVLFTKGVLL